VIGRGVVGEDMAGVGAVHAEVVVPSSLFFSGGGLGLSIDECVSLFGGRALSGTSLEGGKIHWGETSGSVGWVCGSGGGSELSHRITDDPSLGFTAPNLIVDCH
jgi:hypothetical protein